MFDSIIALDKKLLLAINHWHSPFFDDFFYIFTGQKIWLLVALAIIFVIIKRYKRDSWKILLSITVLILVSDQLSSGIIKPLVERLRPTYEPTLQGLINIVHHKKSGGFSFVSSHATNSFAFALFSSMLFRNRIYTVSIVLWSMLTAYSRIYLGVHYPLDVVGGTIVGISVGIVVFILSRKIFSIRDNNNLDNRDALIIISSLLLTISAIIVWHTTLVSLV